MKKKTNLVVLSVLLIAGALFASKYNTMTENYITLTKDTKVVATSNESFDKMMDVLMSPRCINCHPNDNIPKQGNDSHPHYFGMSGGKEDHGFDATKCMTCHQKENNNFSGVPGAPEWSLAPDKMKWEGLTRIEIAKSMLNPENNGNRDLKELEKHLTEHKLVLWAWDPGIDANGVQREKPPVPLDEYKEAVKKWIADGAIVPEN